MHEGYLFGFVNSVTLSLSLFLKVNISSSCFKEEIQEKIPSDVCNVQLCNELYPALSSEKKGEFVPSDVPRVLNIILM